LAGLLLLASTARTDQPTPKQAPAPTDVPKNNDIVVVVGSPVALRLPAGEVMAFALANEEIATVRADAADAGQYSIVGKSVGTSTLTVKLKDKSELIYTIIVEAPRLQVAKRLRSGFIAYSVDLPKESTVGAILGLNDYVVVFFTKSADEDKKTIVLMKNIRVLAAPTGTVILEVTTEEAKLLKSSQESGLLALGLIAEADLKDEKVLQDRKGERAGKK
jgi:Flp pilus assembly protein CpaB